MTPNYKKIRNLQYIYPGIGAGIGALLGSTGSDEDNAIRNTTIGTLLGAGIGIPIGRSIYKNRIFEKVAPGFKRYISNKIRIRPDVEEMADKINKSHIEDMAKNIFNNAGPAINKKTSTEQIAQQLDNFVNHLQKGYHPEQSKFYNSIAETELENVAKAAFKKIPYSELKNFEQNDFSKKLINGISINPKYNTADMDKYLEMLKDIEVGRYSDDVARYIEKINLPNVNKYKNMNLVRKLDEIGFNNPFTFSKTDVTKFIEQKVKEAVLAGNEKEYEKLQELAEAIYSDSEFKKLLIFKDKK